MSNDYDAELARADYHARLWAHRREQLAREQQREAAALARHVVQQQLFRAQEEAEYRARVRHAEREREHQRLVHRRRVEEEQWRMFEQQRLARRNAVRVSPYYGDAMVSHLRSVYSHLETNA
jgi:hypothetical protein